MTANRGGSTSDAKTTHKKLKTENKKKNKKPRKKKTPGGPEGVIG